MRVIQQSESLGAAADLEEGLQLLQQVRVTGNSALRLYRPQATMAFGQRDVRRPGFQRAAQAAEDLGFAPLVRKAGGTGMPYHRGCLIVDHIEADAQAMLGTRRRFERFGQLLASALSSVGVDAAVGEIPGEYCPGEFSVHGQYADPDQSKDSGGEHQEHRVKLVGTAQRVISGAWLFSSAIVVKDSEPLQEVLESCYQHLGIEWDPRTVGSASQLKPGLSVETVERAVLEQYARHYPLTGNTF